MPAEFLHSQDDGGAGAGMADFWELHWKSKKSGGGFIWAMLDEAIVRTDFNNVLDANGLNANDGILGPHREKEGSFFALREIFSPVKIWMKELPSEFNGRIEAENRYHFTNLNQCSFQWAFVNFRKPNENLAGYTVQKKGTAVPSSIAPGATGSISFALPAEYKKYDALVFVALDPSKKEIYKWTWKVKSNEQLLDDIIAINDSTTSVTETDTTYTLRGSEVSVFLNKKTGMLAGTKHITMDNLSFAKRACISAGQCIINRQQNIQGWQQ